MANDPVADESLKKQIYPGKDFYRKETYKSPSQMSFSDPKVKVDV